MSKRKLIVSFLLLMITIASAVVCLANDKDNRIDFRKTRIARVSFLEGAASLQRQSTDQWDGAALNVPVFPGDLVHSNANSRLELELYGGFIRMSENTTLELVEFSPKLYRFDLSAGLTTFSFGEDRPQIEIATPQVAVNLKSTGIYRINVQNDGTTEISVQEGQAELFSKFNTFKLDRGKKAIFPNNSSNVLISQVLSSDAWDNWNNERELLVSANSVNGYFKPRPYLYGGSALSLYGSWLNVPKYGFVWRPNNIAAGWAPYTIGRWTYYRATGWTWVSQEAWGWLPYHHGYWTFLSGYGWVWVPDGLDWYWSPALVSWYYGTWNGNPYVCWHPWNNNWNGNGWNGNGWGGVPQVSNKEKLLENALNHPKTMTPVVVGLPVGDFTSGNGVVSGKNIHPEITIDKKLNIDEVALPKTQGFVVDATPDKQVIQNVISKPLVTQIAANPENGSNHHKYELAKKNTLNNPTAYPKDAPIRGKNIPTQVADEPKVRNEQKSNNSSTTQPAKASSGKSTNFDHSNHQTKTIAPSSSISSSSSSSSSASSSSSSSSSSRSSGSHSSGKIK